MDVYGFKTEFLIGARMPGAGRVRDFTLLKSGGVTEGIATDDNFRRAHTHQWLGRMLSSVVERIGNVEVYAAFRGSKFKTLPAVIQQLPMQDVIYGMALGHMHTYGPRIDVGEQPCPKCGREAAYTKISLVRPVGAVDGGLEVESGTLTEFDEIPVKLPGGYLWEKPLPPSQPMQAYLHCYGKTWNVYFFRLPVLADYILREEEYGAARHNDLRMRVASDCLVRVERWEGMTTDDEGEPAGGTKVEELPAEVVTMLAKEMVETIDGRDRLTITRAMARAPQIRMTVKAECKGCHRDIRLALNPMSFFPVG